MLKSYSFDKGNFDGIQFTFSFCPANIAYHSLLFAENFAVDIGCKISSLAVRIAIRFSALKNCGRVVRLLVVGVEGGGGGRCWSPEVPIAGGVGGDCKDCWSPKVARTEGIGIGGGCRSCWSPYAANGVDASGGCTCDWSPGVLGAARVGGGFAGVRTKLDAGICPFDD